MITPLQEPFLWALPKTPVASTVWTAPNAVSLGLLQVAIF